MKAEPYLNFGGRCEEAIAFYQQAVGAKVEMLMRFRESPDPVPPGMLSPGFEDKVMHAAIRIGESLVMAADGCGRGNASFNNVALTVSVADEASADRIFNALADGGSVQMPLGKTFFSRRFGMLSDRFGLDWMVVVP